MASGEASEARLGPLRAEYPNANETDQAKEFKISTKYLQFPVALLFKTCGLGCSRLVGDCFWNIGGIKNGDLLLSAKDSGNGEPAPLTVLPSASHAVKMFRQRPWAGMVPGCEYCFLQFLFPTTRGNNKKTGAVVARL